MGIPDSYKYSHVYEANYRAGDAVLTDNSRENSSAGDNPPAITANIAPPINSNNMHNVETESVASTKNFAMLSR